MMELLPSTWYILISALFLSVSSSVLGSILFHKKQALIGDVITHAVLPGVCIAFLVFREKNMFWFLVGGSSTAMLATYIVQYLHRKKVLSEDILLASTLSIFFGIGVLFLSYIQQLPWGNQSGIDRFIFGQASTLSLLDAQVIAIISAAILTLFILGFRAVKIWVFDIQFAGTLNFPFKIVEALFIVFLCLLVMTGLQSVGIVLMSAMFVLPPSIAHFWKRSFTGGIIVAGLVSFVASAFGIMLSLLVPHIPTGPAIVLSLFGVLIVSLLLGKYNSLYSKLKAKKRHQDKIDEEHVLKSLYKLIESIKTETVDIFALHKATRMSFSRIEKICKKLEKRKLIKFSNNKIQLTPAGKAASKRIVRLHRLWELYLSEYLQLPEDHLHESAEDIEHYITPEVEAHLLTIMNFPKKDPHQKDIP
ncbi:metal ABC transporter permease [Thermonema sp.]|uniref:metal ABC transporter permease n=1 Tax=Thermonema sp. TaxID=2231181 RepID=UPI00258D2524|nr:metal ABC transporter permease [Thermonema sp.]